MSSIRLDQISSLEKRSRRFLIISDVQGVRVKVFFILYILYTQFALVSKPSKKPRFTDQQWSVRTELKISHRQSRGGVARWQRISLAAQFFQIATPGEPLARFPVRAQCKLRCPKSTHRCVDG